MTDPAQPRPVPGPPRPGPVLARPPVPAGPGTAAPVTTGPDTAGLDATGPARTAGTDGSPFAGLAERPVAEHVAAFEAEHARLERELGTIDQL